MCKKTAEIALLNDAFRTTFVGGAVVLTKSIMGLHPAQRRLLMMEVQGYDDFTEGNDPYGEHDFGSIDAGDDKRVIFKIDYYALDMKHGSEDPADPKKTRRVMTIMFADEY